jgi:hypothetical protein
VIVRGGLRAFSTAALCSIGALLSACGPSHYARAPGVPLDLSGHWILEPSASDDAAALIAKSVPVPRKARPQYTDNPDANATGDHTRGSGRRGGRSQSGSGTGVQSSEDVAPSWGKVRPRDFIAAFALPPTHLDVLQSADRMTLASDARRREFAPGDETPYSVNDRYGSRRVRAGWDGGAFNVVSEDGARLNVSERFVKRSDDRLEMTVEFKAQGIKSLKIRSVFRRATAAELEAPSDGPPPPAPH